jgi:mitogen-activated protein kinase kinase kinase
MIKTIRKGNLIEAHLKSYCFYVLDGIDPNPALCRRINDAEVLRIVSDSSRVERNRLILRKIHEGEPDEGQLKTAANIAAQIQTQQNNNLIIPASTRSQLKIEKITGEALPPVSYPLSPASMEERKRHIFAAQQDLQRADHPTPRPRPRETMKELYGGRPPSELITQDLSTFFPDFQKAQLENTVRMSIRRSHRISRATSRLSMMSNASGVSMASSIHDAPPVPNLPAISDAWLREQPKGLRPLSVLRLGQGAGVRDSFASSILEPLDEESPLEGDSRKSFSSYASASGLQRADSDSHSTYYNDSRSSVAASTLSVDDETALNLNKRLSQAVHEDSEESDDELQEYLEADSWDNVKYMQGALIGQGSFGSVYLALHSVTGELMAVKQVETPGSNGTALDAKKNNMVEALKHEIGLLRELKHENIVQYLGSNSEGSHLNIFLEYVPGGSVAKMLVNYGPLGEGLINNFVRQILQGLEYLHSKDIIHRDIKGANILIDHKGSVKISDFGISKRVEASTILNSAAKKGQRVSLQGSVFWMAPEVVKQTAYTRKADIWSLGCLIVEMLTGQHPHPNCTQLQAIFKIGHGSEGARPAVPENASSELRRFLDSTFDLEHERRPEAAELLNNSGWMSKDFADAAGAKK